MSKETENLQDGVYIVGTVINATERRGNAKATGNPYCMLTYMIHCGNKIVSVQQTDAENAPRHTTGTRVAVDIEPSFRDNGLVIISGNVVKR